jgi:hypothetical protein
LASSRPLNCEEKVSSIIPDLLGNMIQLNITDASLETQKNSSYQKWIGLTSEIRCTKLIDDIDNFMVTGNPIVRDQFSLLENKRRDLSTTRERVRSASTFDEEQEVKLNPDLISLRRRTAPNLWKYISSVRIDWEPVFEIFNAEYQTERESLTVPLGNQISTKSFKTAITRIGFNCTGGELASIMHTYGDPSGTRVNFRTFIRDMMPQLVRYPPITYTISGLSLGDGLRGALVVFEPLVDNSNS